MTVLMGETSPVGVQRQGVPAPLAFLRGVLCLNSSYRPVGHCAPLPADGYAQHPYASSRGPVLEPADRRRHDRHAGPPGHRARPRGRGGRDPRAACRSMSPSSASRASPTPIVGVSLAKQAEFDAIGRAHRLEQPAGRVVLPVRCCATTTRRAAASSASQSGLETYKGQREADLRRLPAAARR